MTTDRIIGPVVLVEDDDTLREATVQALELSGLEVQSFESAARAARFLMPSFTGCVVTDIRMPGMDGLQLFDRIKEIDPKIPVVLITGHGDIGMAVKAMHEGAFDFLTKPFATDHLSAVVRKALQSRHLVLDNRSMRIALALPADDIIAQSRAMAQLRTMALQVARTDLDVVIEGETGTGKDMLARLLHRQSSRQDRPFIAMSCSTLGPDPEFDRVLQQAGGGTVLLDGCNALTLPAQARLVALLDARDRARSEDHRGEDFRLLTSTPVALSDLVGRSMLREDLFHRLNSLRLYIPPLRERREDIPELFARFVRQALDQTGRKRFEMNASDRKRLLEHDWPGNARELRNYAFGAVLNLRRQALLPHAAPASKRLATRVGEYERMVITEALETTGGNVVRAAALLHTPRKTLYEKLSKYRIDPETFRAVRKLQ